LLGAARATDYETVALPTASQWMAWDRTDIVSELFSGGSANDGVRLKLLDEQESYHDGGPALPSRASPMT
jgi:hypothetical protein